MISSLIIKFGKKILLAAILVAIIVAVFIINPWNMFGGGLKMHQTTNNISAIREIGELITAEYYGETISTINQSRLRMIYADDVNAQADIIYQQIKQDLLSIYSEKLENIDSDNKEGLWKFKWFRRAKREKKESLTNINEVLINNNTYTDNDSLYEVIIEYIWMHETNSEKKANRELKPKEKNTAFWLLYQDVVYSAENLSDKDFDNFMRQGLPIHNKQVFSDFYYQEKADKITNQEDKKELSMIGRGWVKAGFNFEKLDESNFLFDKDAGIVHLFGVQAEILNADINPWFIPERKIPGFQIIESNRHVDFYDAVEVKTYCVEKLRRMALEAGILEQAEVQGKEALKSFIGLLSGVEINEVHFHYDPFSVYAKEILSDQFISYDESRMLDTLIKNQLDTIFKLEEAKTNYTENQSVKELKIHQLRTAIGQMKLCWFEEKGNYYNRFSSLIFRITNDSIISFSEYQDLESLKLNVNTILSERSTSTINPNYKDQLVISVWFNDKVDYLVEYNRAVQTIFEKTKYCADVNDTLFSTNDSLTLFKANLKLNVIEERTYKSVYLLTYFEDSISKDTLLKLIYPGKPGLWCNFFNEYNLKDSLKLKRESYPAQRVLSISDTMFLSEYFDTISGDKCDSLYLSLDIIKWDSCKVTPTQKYYCDTVFNTFTWLEEEKQITNYIIDKYWKQYSVRFFTRMNSRMKETLDHKNMQKRAVELKENIQAVFEN